MSQLRSFDLSTGLSVLKIQRKKIINDFSEKAPEIYLPSYRYENMINQLNLSISKYFISWINHHIKVYLEYSSNININVENINLDQHKSMIEFLNIAYRKLLTTTNKNEKIDEVNVDFLKKIIDEQVEYLDKILSLGDLTDQNFNNMLLEYEKNKVIFARKIKEMKEK